MILSVTTFPKRILSIGPCLESIARQMTREDRGILWLGEEQFPNGLEDVPPAIHVFREEEGGRFAFRFTPNLRSYTKLIPALRAFPEEVIVTFDDDIIYDPRTLPRLREAHARDPKAIWAHGVSDLYLVGDAWHRTSGPCGFAWSPTPLRLMLGVGGVLYPPHALDDVIFDWDLLKRCAPTSDDVSFWYAAVRRGTPIRRVTHPLVRFHMTAGSLVEGSLCLINEVNGDLVNRQHIANLLAQDPALAHRLEAVAHEHRLMLAASRVHRLLVHYPRQVIYCLAHGGVKSLAAELRLKFSTSPKV